MFGMTKNPSPCAEGNVTKGDASAATWKKQLYEGCLIGGAVGDALGYPVEFLSEAAIQRRFGSAGIRTLSEAGTPALISDDTQMTLFAANAIVYSACHPEGAPVPSCLKQAYREWYMTQYPAGKKSLLPTMWVYEDLRMHAARAPGNTCLGAICAFDDTPEVRPAENHSKGCGTVMRAAPFGLMHCPGPAEPPERGEGIVRQTAGIDASLTHGHPAAQASSEMLAAMVYRLTQQQPDHSGRLEAEIGQIKVGNEALEGMVQAAIRLALDPAVTDLEGIHALGEGWVGDEALVIAVFCAVRHQDDFAAALRAAVNHKGDSDSTGAICGNLLGAWLGIRAVGEAFDLENLELRDVTLQIADDLYRAVHGETGKPGEDAGWDFRYFLR